MDEQQFYFSLLSSFLNSISFNETNESKLLKLNELLNQATKEREKMTSVWITSMDDLISRIRIDIESLTDNDIEWEDEERS
jgi:CTP:phosphocholine cytidylyltransferase-like protein